MTTISVWTGLGLACLAVLLRYPLGRDHQIFALVADGLLAGRWPYVDVWDYKPPGIYFVTALGRALRPTAVGVRLVEALAFVALVPAFALLSRRWIGDARAGLVGAVISLVTVTSFGFWHTGQPEVFAGVVLSWALVLASGRPRAAAWFAVGAACGVAALFKPTCAFPGAVLALWAAHEQRAHGRAAVALGFHAAGLVAVFSATAALFGVAGALPELVDAVVDFASHHARESYTEDGPNQHLHRAVVGFARAAPFALGCLVPLFGLRTVHALEARGRWAAVGAVAASVVGVAVQGRFFLYHQATAAVLIGLPAGMGLWKVRLAVPAPARSLLMVLAAAGLLALVPPSAWSGVRGGGELDAERSHRALAGFSQAAIDEGGAYVAERTPPGSLYVWGMEPGLYLASGRAPASRYITNEPQRTWWSAEQRRAELIEELERDPPVAIVVQHDDVIPFLFSASEDSFDELRQFPAMKRLLARSYDVSGTFDSFDVYLRRATQPAPASASPTQPSQPTSSGAR